MPLRRRLPLPPAAMCADGSLPAQPWSGWLSAGRRGRHAALLAAALALGRSAEAKVAWIELQAPQAGPGGVEVVHGMPHGELDPADPANAVITDLQLAPRNAGGRVEYAARFTLARPAATVRTRGVLWYDLVNRGAPVPPGEGATQPADFGHIGLISGWQGDLVQTASNWAVAVPVAANPDGTPITGPVLARLADAPAGTRSRPLALLGTVIPYDAASLDTRRARLVARQSETRTGQVGPEAEVPPEEWAFADCTSTPFPGRANPRMLCLRSGFDSALLYQLSYDARDPKVLGVGLAAMRDVASFFRYEAADGRGTPNPIAGQVAHGVAQGISQSGNALKTFILLGFNRDEAGRTVFDGANPHIAGRLTAANVRFGLPSGSGTLYEPGGEGALWWTPYAGAGRERPATSLLDRCTATGTCPKIFETFGASEFNARLMTVALTGTNGRTDLPLPANVRRYYFPGTTHGSDPKGGFARAPAASPGCVLARNPNPETETMNALQAALVSWVVDGTGPPPSRYPTLAAGDLVANTAEAMGFPALPGVPPPTGLAVGLMDYDFGDGLRLDDLSGTIARQPPGLRGIVPALMPRVGPDGNETAGVPSVLHQAPLGTYTGWNVTAAGCFKGQPCGGGLTGGYVPFACMAAERQAAGDPRPSLEERYGTSEGYVCAVRAAASHGVADRVLLPADAGRLVGQATAGDPLAGLGTADGARATARRICGGGR